MNIGSYSQYPPCSQHTSNTSGGAKPVVATSPNSGSKFWGLHEVQCGQAYCVALVAKLSTLSVSIWATGICYPIDRLLEKNIYLEKLLELYVYNICLNMYYE